MTLKTLNRVAIAGVTAALPEDTLGVDYFSELYGKKEVARVTRGTGIRSIRIARNISTTDLIAAAASHLLKSMDVDPMTIDGLIVVTQTPDVWSPGTSYAVHSALRLPQDCVLFDLNAGCAGYAAAILQASALIATKVCENVLVCTGDVNTRLSSDANYQVRMLFGDGASATLVTPGSDSIHYVGGSDSSGRGSLGVALRHDRTNTASASVGYLQMDGAAVMSFALKRVPEVIGELLSSLSMSKNDIDAFILHQPNEFILRYLRDTLQIDAERFAIDVDGIGNTNSSSIPIVISRRFVGECSGNGRVLICGFGVGLAWNAMQLNLATTKIFPHTELKSLSGDDPNSDYNGA